MTTMANRVARHSPPIQACQSVAIRPSTCLSNDGRCWYILRVQPNRERAIAAQLEERGFRTYVPIEARQVSYGVLTWFGVSQRKRIAERPVFPGYLFLRFGFVLDACRRYWFDLITGIHGFLTVDNVAHPIAERDMWLIENIERELRMRAENQSKRKRFSPGQKVRIEFGAFANLNAIVAGVELMDDQERITLLLNIMGRDTQTTLPVDHVTAL